LDPLQNSVNMVGAALGDDARHPQFIETVHGRGYRFIASVSEAPQPEAQQDTSSRAFRKSLIS
jgi:DNA-binding winged helix-turn-helix (wHTH) protein